jgi:histidinol-phosphate aminotransferase
MSRRFWSDLAAGLTPYTPGEQPRERQLLKLNTNENPFPPSPQVLQALREVSGEDLRRYPDPASTRLCEAAARAFGVRPEQVFAGNGSDEVLAHVFAGLLKRDGELLFPDISYSFYPVWARLYDVSYRTVPLRDDFTLAAEDYDAAAASVLFPNPNAPTGIAIGREELRAFLSASTERLVVVDEAYVDFGADSAVPLIDEFDNLLVVHTLSKSRSLAGMRLGFAFAQAPLLEALRRVKDSFNSYPVDAVAERVGIAALEDEAWFAQCCGEVVRSRDMLAAGLVAMGFDVLPSAANFLLVRHGEHAGRQLFDALRERGVLLRRWDKPRIEDCLRITVGSYPQCEELLAVISEVLSDAPPVSSARG